MDVLDHALDALPRWPIPDAVQKLPGTTRGSPRRSRTANASRISRYAVKSRCAAAAPVLINELGDLVTALAGASRVLNPQRVQLAATSPKVR